jgi:hypothetical protein
MTWGSEMASFGQHSVSVSYVSLSLWFDLFAQPLPVERFGIIGWDRIESLGFWFGDYINKSTPHSPHTRLVLRVQLLPISHICSSFLGFSWGRRGGGNRTQEASNEAATHNNTGRTTQGRVQGAHPNIALPSGDRQIYFQAADFCHRGTSCLCWETSLLDRHFSRGQNFEMRFLEAVFVTAIGNLMAAVVSGKCSGTRVYCSSSRTSQHQITQQSQLQAGARSAFKCSRPEASIAHTGFFSALNWALRPPKVPRSQKQL